MVCWTATGAATPGEIDLVLRDGRVLVVCEVKTRSSTAFGSPLEAVDRAEGRPAAPARRPVAGGAPRAPGRGADRPGRRAGPPARRAAARPRPRGRLMRFATARTISLSGATGHLIDVQVDLAQGVVATALVGPARRVDQRGPRPVPGRRHQQRLRLADDPAGDDPALAGRPAQARAALRPRHRRRGAGRGRQAPGARAREGGVRRRADPRRAAARGPGVLPMTHGGQGPRHHLRGGARAAGGGGGAGPRHGRDRRPLAAAGGRAPARRRDPRRAAGRAADQRLAAVLARRPAHRRRRHGRRARAWPTPATRSRSPRPAATT